MDAAVRVGGPSLGTGRWRARLYGSAEYRSWRDTERDGPSATARPGCRVITTPGVIPRGKSDTNVRIPDLGVTCSPIRVSGTLPDPLLLIEILSPSNEAKTRANVWAYISIPTVREVLLLSSTAIRAELLRRDAEAAWPDMPEMVTGTQPLRLDSIGFEVMLSDLYATSSLV
jgi:Uma2 family endonuclease